MRSTERRDRVRGALIGAIVADAFGNPFEGAPSGTLEAELRRRAQQPGPWRYTDDGAMIIAVAESLCETHPLEPAKLEPAQYPIESD